MPRIILKTDMPDQAARVLTEAIETESRRLKYSMELAKTRLSKFERKYKTGHRTFVWEAPIWRQILPIIGRIHVKKRMHAFKGVAVVADA